MELYTVQQLTIPVDNLDAFSGILRVLHLHERLPSWISLSGLAVDLCLSSNSKEIEQRCLDRDG